MGSRDGTQGKKRGLHVRHPVPHGLVHRVLQGATPRAHGDHFGPQECHALHVGGLAAHVLLPHVDRASDAEASRRRGHGHAVLPRPSLGHDAALAHPRSEEDLPQGVIDLVGPRVVQILPLQENPHPPLGRQAVGLVDRRGTAAEVPQEPPQIPPEVPVVPVPIEGLFQLLQGPHKSFRHKLPPKGSKVSPTFPPSIIHDPHSLLLRWRPLIPPGAPPPPPGGSTLRPFPRGIAPPGY